MPSAHKSALRANSKIWFEEPPTLHDQQLGNSPFPNLNHSIEAALRAKRIELGLEHRDLDLTISALTETGASDELLVSRLKKRRLQLKDEIARIEGCLPD